MADPLNKPLQQLRKGWTTGACATAATKAAFAALLSGEFPDPVQISLPRGETPSFELARKELGQGWAMAGIIKYAGDDPDVTHGALVLARVRLAKTAGGVTFVAGEGVGTVTRAGLPVAPGEAAINPAPRKMMREVIAEIAGKHGVAGDVEIEISIPGGQELALKTWNPRLGIVGGLSVLGTTGVVNPFSCSAWIASIQRGVDVARAAGLHHIGGATGSASEKAMRAHHGLPLEASIDMGDFAGGLLKYLRRHPVPRVTIAGGFAKMVKLAQGAEDLHSARSQVDFSWLADACADIGCPPPLVARVGAANSALEVLGLAGDRGDKQAELAGRGAAGALATAQNLVGDAGIEIDVIVADREGGVLGHAGA